MASEDKGTSGAAEGISSTGDDVYQELFEKANAVASARIESLFQSAGSDARRASVQLPIAPPTTSSTPRDQIKSPTVKDNTQKEQFLKSKSAGRRATVAQVPGYLQPTKSAAQKAVSGGRSFSTENRSTSSVVNKGSLRSTKPPIGTNSKTYLAKPVKPTTGSPKVFTSSKVSKTSTGPLSPTSPGPTSPFSRTSTTSTGPNFLKRQTSTEAKTSTGPISLSSRSRTSSTSQTSTGPLSPRTEAKTFRSRPSSPVWRTSIDKSSDRTFRSRPNSPARRTSIDLKTSAKTFRSRPNSPVGRTSIDLKTSTGPTSTQIKTSRTSTGPGSFARQTSIETKTGPGSTYGRNSSSSTGTSVESGKTYLNPTSSSSRKNYTRETTTATRSVDNTTPKFQRKTYVTKSRSGSPTQNAVSEEIITRKVVTKREESVPSFDRTFKPIIDTFETGTSGEARTSSVFDKETDYNRNSIFDKERDFNKSSTFDTEANFITSGSQNRESDFTTSSNVVGSGRDHEESEFATSLNFGGGRQNKESEFAKTSNSSGGRQNRESEFGTNSIFAGERPNNGSTFSTSSHFVSSGRPNTGSAFATSSNFGGGRQNRESEFGTNSIFAGERPNNESTSSHFVSRGSPNTGSAFASSSNFGGGRQNTKSEFAKTSNLSSGRQNRESEFGTNSIFAGESPPNESTFSTSSHFVGGGRPNTESAFASSSVFGGGSHFARDTVPDSYTHQTNVVTESQAPSFGLGQDSSFARRSLFQSFNPPQEEDESDSKTSIFDNESEFGTDSIFAREKSTPGYSRRVETYEKSDPQTIQTLDPLAHIIERSSTGGDLDSFQYRENSYSGGQSVNSPRIKAEVPVILASSDESYSTDPKERNRLFSSRVKSSQNWSRSLPGRSGNSEIYFSESSTPSPDIYEDRGYDYHYVTTETRKVKPKDQKILSYQTTEKVPILTASSPEVEESFEKISLETPRIDIPLPEISAHHFGSPPKKLIESLNKSHFEFTASDAPIITPPIERHRQGVVDKYLAGKTRGGTRTYKSAWAVGSGGAQTSSSSQTSTLARYDRPAPEPILYEAQPRASRSSYQIQSTSSHPRFNVQRSEMRTSSR